MREVEAVRAELEQIAALPALARRRESIEDLAANLDTEEAHLWAKVDLYAAFGSDSIEVPAARDLTSRAGWVELARNLLIMVPLLITWFGISIATHAYGAMIKADSKAAQRPFIALWQEGFGGRTAVTLHRVAVADVIAFITVIGVSLWLSALRRKIDVTVEAEEKVTWNRLREALLEASLHLNTKAFDTPARFNEELARVIINLRAVTEQVDQASSRAESAIGSIDGTVAGLATSVGGFAAGVADQQAAMAGLGERVDGVAGGLAGLTDRITVLGDELERTIAEQAQLTASVAAALRDLAEVSATVVAAGGAQSSAAADFVTRIDQHAGQQGEMVRSMAEAAAGAAGAAAAISAAAGQLDAVQSLLNQRSMETAESIRASTSGLDAAMTGAATSLDSSTNRIHQAVEEWRQVSEASRASLQAVSEALPRSLDAASAHLGATASQLSAHASESHQQTQASVEAAARLMAELTAGLQSNMTAIATDVRHASESLSAAVDRLSGTTASMEAALHRAGREGGVT